MIIKKGLVLTTILIVGSGMLLAGCDTIKRETGFGEKAQTGAIGGAAAGGLIAAAADANPLWIAASTILGGITGGAIGDWLDKKDQKQYAQATYSAFETRGPGQEISWNNAKTGASGTTKITDQYKNDAGFTCKTFTQRIHGKSRTETTSGVACQQANGSWKVMKAG